MFKNVGWFENLFYLKKKIGEKNKKKSYDVHQYSKLEGVQKIYILSKKRRIVFIFDAKMATFTCPGTIELRWFHPLFLSQFVYFFWNGVPYKFERDVHTNA